MTLLQISFIKKTKSRQVSSTDTLHSKNCFPPLFLIANNPCCVYFFLFLHQTVTEVFLLVISLRLSLDVCHFSIDYLVLLTIVWPIIYFLDGSLSPTLISFFSYFLIFYLWLQTNHCLEDTSRSLNRFSPSVCETFV